MSAQEMVNVTSTGSAGSSRGAGGARGGGGKTGSTGSVRNDRDAGGGAVSLKNYVSDTVVMTGRVLKHTLRSVDTIITVIAMPVAMLLAMVYLFGGAMKLGAANYVNYAVPGILLICIGSGIAYTAFRLNSDVTQGIFERFHSMPIAKSSILGGHVVTSVVFNAVSVIVVLLVGLLVGFRPHTTLACALLACVILLVFTIAMTWIAVTSGLLAKSPEASGIFSYLLLGLMFVSSGFAPTDSMPAGLRAFAANQPMSPVINSVRSLLVDGKVTGAVWIALAWCVAIWVVFQAVALWAYRRRLH